MKAKIESVKMNVCLPKPVFQRMALVESELGVRKSAQIATLVAKYSRQEYPIASIHPVLLEEP